MTPCLDSPPGIAALTRLLRAPAMMAFDYDGTLAPICTDPGNARIDAAWANRLRRIGRRWPVAVISGRTLADVSSRLGFEPAFIAGNHGAESAIAQAPSDVLTPLHVARRALAEQRETWAVSGVVLEDKGMSLAVHYRNASCPQSAAASIGRLLSAMPAELSVSHGKAVFNITVVAAPDKGVALRCAMQSCGVRQALYVGDDVNDEPAFAAANERSDSLTVRVGSRRVTTAARFSLTSQARVGRLLHRLAQWRG